MPDFLISLIAVVVILGFMILIHEFGHYAVAKWLGVRVEVFSIGFGKRLLGFRKGDTDYRISAIPLGGYVKMSGENPMDERTGDPAEFLSHSRWHRFLIAIAGPTMNIMLAIFLLTSVYMVHYEYPVFMDKPAVIDGVRANSAAAQADLKPGDRIIKIDGITNPTWEQVQPRVMISPNQPLAVTIQRGRHDPRENHCPEADHLVGNRLRRMVPFRTCYRRPSGSRYTRRPYRPEGRRQNCCPRWTAAGVDRSHD